MTKTPTDNANTAFLWLKDAALPLWLSKGVVEDETHFVESLDLDGKDLFHPRRSMVQARQIYAYRTAWDLNLVEEDDVGPIVESATKYFIKNFSSASGGFIHSIQADGKIANPKEDLYSQAFGLFGLAHAYAVTRDPQCKKRAMMVLDYLHRSRQFPAGGFSETDGKNWMYEANPHMHLFEAGVAWMEIDRDLVWSRFAESVLALCMERFMVRGTGLICEHFGVGWKPTLAAGKFVYEPGHLCEWAWLMGRYEKVTGKDLGNVRVALFQAAEKFGKCPIRNVLLDEVWSDGTPKSKTSRFWTQCEYIKCAMQLHHDRLMPKENLLEKSDLAMGKLLQYFQTPIPGMWFDLMNEDGSMKQEPARASALYHIIGAVIAMRAK